jgi:predicted nicotinamide N-methyase
MGGNYPFVDSILPRFGGRSWLLRSVTDQDALISQVRTDDDLKHFPYGLMLWASALALAQRLDTEPRIVVGRRVLELGAGIGLVGLVAQALGAQVTQTDYHPDALALCRLNAERNRISGIAVERGDWREWPTDLGDFPVVLGADILYDRALHPVLAALLPRVVAPGGHILLADPLRPQALEFIERREAEGWGVRTEGQQVEWGGTVRDIALFWLTLPASADLGVLGG